MRSGESLATVLLVGRLASEGLLPLKASEFWALRDQVGEVRALLGRSERLLIEEHRLAPPFPAGSRACSDEPPPSPSW